MIREVISTRFPPEAYLIGAQKAGTTTLAYLLDQHPMVTVSQPKEPHFFTRNRDKKGLGWYRERFSGPTGSVLLDASTTYSMAPLGGKGPSEFAGVPEMVFSLNPDARFVYLLRDPVERTYSAHWHYVRMGRENRGFGEVIRNGSPRLDAGDYHGQLMLWLEHFPLTSFHFVLFEDMKEAPERAAGECFGFLGVDEGFPVHLDSPKHRSYNVSRMGRGLNRLLTRRPWLDRLVAASRPAVPKKVRARLRGVQTGSDSIPAMKSADREFLIEYFRERNRRLEELIGIPLDRWQA